MAKLASIVLSLALAIGFLPAGAWSMHGESDTSASTASGQPAPSGPLVAASFGTVGESLAMHDDGENVAAVKAAAEVALAYSSEQGFSATALKDAFEEKLEGALCFSVETGAYHVLHGGGYYAFEVDGGKVASARAVAQEDQLPVYASLADAIGAGASDAAFLTRGLNAQGDGGHGRYVRTEALAQGEPGATIGENAYALASAESAVNVFQLGYDDASGAGANAAIDAFHESGFHTLVFPKGEYRLTAGVWSNVDNRSYYGLGATLYTDGEVALDGKNSSHSSLWTIRGNVVWGEGEKYTITDENGTTREVRENGYHTVRNIELCGIGLERRENTSGYRRMITVRNARNTTINRCTIDGGDTYASGAATSTNGAIVDFYGDYNGIAFTNCTVEGEAGIDIRDLCDHVNNPPAHTVLDPDSPTGGRNVVVRGCNITTHNFDEGLPIFAGNEQGLGTWKDGVFTEYATLTHCLVENVTVEDNRYTMLAPATDKQRVVAITCGYQDSPVRNARVVNNVFDVYANSYLILFGWAEDCVFANNDVTLRSTKDGASIVPVIRATHSRTGPTRNVRVENNTMKFPDEGTSIQRMVDTALGEGAVSFSGNDVTVAGSVARVFDSTATSTDNTFHLNAVKRLYDRVGEVARNTYEIATLGGLYESYDTDAQADLDIHDEHATIGEVTGNLLSFNGAPRYNGHALTFADCVYDIESATNADRRVAYSAAAIADELSLSFIGCDIPFFDSAPYNTIQKDEGKVALAIGGWNATTYSWSDDCSSVTASRTGGVNGSYVQSETASATRAVTREPSCEGAGEATWTSETFANAAFATQEKTVTIAPLGHVDDGGVVTREATESAEGEITHTCTRCGKVLGTDTIPKKQAASDTGSGSEIDDGGGGAGGSGNGGNDNPDNPSGDTDTGEARATYSIILNPNGTWSGAAAGYTFSSGADFAKFACVLVDGTVIDPASYDVESGSTKVTLHADYLATLSPGVHTATIRSVDGDASTTFTVQRAEEAGDSSQDDASGKGAASDGEPASGASDSDKSSDSSDVGDGDAEESDASRATPDGNDGEGNSRSKPAAGNEPVQQAGKSPNGSASNASATPLPGAGALPATGDADAPALIGAAALAIALAAIALATAALLWRGKTRTHKD